jgi:hypothetical protein
MGPGLWLNEGGQSAAGAAIDHLLRLHPAARETAGKAEELGTSLGALLAEEAGRRGGAGAVPGLVGELWVAMYAPKGVAPELIDQMRKAVAAVQAIPEMEMLLAAQGATAMKAGPAELAVITKWGVEDFGKGISKPATFIVQPGGSITFRKIGEKPEDRPSSQQILDALAAR